MHRSVNWMSVRLRRLCEKNEMLMQKQNEMTVLKRKPAMMTMTTKVLFLTAEVQTHRLRSKSGLKWEKSCLLNQQSATWGNGRCLDKVASKGELFWVKYETTKNNDGNDNVQQVYGRRKSDVTTKRKVSRKWRSSWNNVANFNNACVRIKLVELERLTITEANEKKYGI